MDDIEVDPLSSAPPSNAHTRPSTSSADAPPPAYPKRHHHYKPPKMPLDAIDVLDESVSPTFLRHHSGPFDAVTKSMFMSKNKNPLAALEHSTQAVLEATPEVSVHDSLEKHVPLQNTAVVEPGQRPFGDDEPLEYQEENLLSDVGRWDGIDYAADDRKAHGRGHWDGAFMNRGHNEAERAARDARSAKGHPKRNPVAGDLNYESADAENMIEMRTQERDIVHSVDPDNMVTILPPDRDIRVDGMQASATAIEEAYEEHHHEEHHDGIHLGIVEGIKRRLSGRRNKHHAE
jgi:hypothetical protein